MIVIGGYNSSNTNNLAIISAERVPKELPHSERRRHHGDTIHHKPAGTPLTPAKR
jgi:4-hydroxy-3-methylbut-2-enyl diphosphate reductase